MIFVRETPLSQEALSALKGVTASARRGRLWSRLAAAAPHSGRKDRSDRAALADAVRARGVCEEVEVWHDAPPAVAEHKQGIYLFVPMHARATLLLDVSSVSGDPRWALYRANRLLVAHWRWLRFPGLDGPWCFLAEGMEVAPVRLGEFHGTELELCLTEDMAWPGDDALLPFSFDEIERFARRRLSVNAAAR
jgi:hypothetical protein